MVQSSPRRSSQQKSGRPTTCKTEIIELCVYIGHRCIYLLIFVDLILIIFLWFTFYSKVALLWGGDLLIGLRVVWKWEKFCNSTFAQDMISGPHLEYGLLLTECQELCLDNTLRLWQQKNTLESSCPGEAFFQQSP